MPLLLLLSLVEISNQFNLPLIMMVIITTSNLHITNGFGAGFRVARNHVLIINMDELTSQRTSLKYSLERKRQATVDKQTINETNFTDALFFEAFWPVVVKYKR